MPLQNLAFFARNSYVSRCRFRWQIVSKSVSDIHELQGPFRETLIVSGQNLHDLDPECMGIYHKSVHLQFQNFLTAVLVPLQRKECIGNVDHQSFEAKLLVHTWQYNRITSFIGTKDIIDCNFTMNTLIARLGLPRSTCLDKRALLVCGQMGLLDIVERKYGPSILLDMTLTSCTC